MVRDKFQEDLAKKEMKRKEESQGQMNVCYSERLPVFKCRSAISQAGFRSKRHRCRVVFAKYPCCYHIDSRNRKILYLYT